MANLVENKKVHLQYEILEPFEAGIELHGFEVKSLRNKQGSLEGAHVIVRGGEAYLVGATIPPYQAANAPETYDRGRARRLLLTRRELGTLAGADSQKGLTIVPISVYSKHRKIKVQIGIARGKKKHDKREDIKARDAKRAIERQIKGALE